MASQGIKGVNLVSFYVTSSEEVANILNGIQYYPSLFLPWEEAGELFISKEQYNLLCDQETADGWHSYLDAMQTRIQSFMVESLDEGEAAQGWAGNCKYFMDDGMAGLRIQSYNERLTVTVDFSDDMVHLEFETPTLTHKNWLEDLAKDFSGEISYLPLFSRVQSTPPKYESDYRYVCRLAVDLWRVFSWEQEPGMTEYDKPELPGEGGFYVKELVCVYELGSSDDPDTWWKTHKRCRCYSLNDEFTEAMLDCFEGFYHDGKWWPAEVREMNKFICPSSKDKIPPTEIVGDFHIWRFPGTKIPLINVSKHPVDVPPCLKGAEFV